MRKLSIYNNDQTKLCLKSIIMKIRRIKKIFNKFLTVDLIFDIYRIKSASYLFYNCDSLIYTTNKKNPHTIY